MTTEVKQCRSVGPEGKQCMKPRGHRKPRHKAQGSKTEWTGGIKSPAREVKIDDGYMSLGEEQALRSAGMGSRAVWGW